MVKPRNPYYKTPRSQVIPNKKKDNPPQNDIEEYEDDGQPDELQEWHDFDPDC